MRHVLYSFRRCPYAMRARLALSVAGVPCWLREVDLKQKPEALRAASPKATVPVLVRSDGRVLDESRAIVAWALEQADPEGWLSVPPAAAEAYLDACDGPFKRHLDRYKYPNRYPDDEASPEVHADAAFAILARWGEAMTPGRGLLSEGFSYVDWGIVPFVRQFAAVDTEVFQRRAPPAIQAWLSALTESARFAAVMRKYPVWAEGPGEVFPDAGG